MGRLGGSSAARLITLAQETGKWADPVVRNKVMRLWAQEQIRTWTNARVRAALSAGQSPGAASSIGKVHQATLNQQISNDQVQSCKIRPHPDVSEFPLRGTVVLNRSFELPLGPKQTP